MFWKRPSRRRPETDALTEDGIGRVIAELRTKFDRASGGAAPRSARASRSRVAERRRQAIAASAFCRIGQCHEALAAEHNMSMLEARERQSEGVKAVLERSSSSRSRARGERVGHNDPAATSRRCALCSRTFRPRQSFAAPAHSSSHKFEWEVHGSIFQDQSDQTNGSSEPCCTGCLTICDKHTPHLPVSPPAPRPDDVAARGGRPDRWRERRP
jgi:hypothetical protein